AAGRPAAAAGAGGVGIAPEAPRLQCNANSAMVQVDHRSGNMMKHLARVLLAGAAVVAGAMLVVSNQASAQAWPTRSIRLIVSTGPGLATDIMARMMSEGLSRQLGQQVFVENVPGAAGMIGAQAAARAAPDGYTFYF